MEFGCRGNTLPRMFCRMEILLKKLEKENYIIEFKLNHQQETTSILKILTHMVEVMLFPLPYQMKISIFY